VVLKKQSVLELRRRRAGDCSRDRWVMTIVMMIIIIIFRWLSLSLA